MDRYVDAVALDDYCGHDRSADSRPIRSGRSDCVGSEVALADQTDSIPSKEKNSS